MTRPQIIRADTIDLQAHEAPSAQTHHRRPIPDGSPAPHQAETLRGVAAETAEEHLQSPRLSWNPDPDDTQQRAALESATGAQNGTLDKMRAGAQQDALAIAQNGGLTAQDTDDGDLDGDADADMDDDMMDKISSSPSIEDGGSTFGLPTLYSSSSGSPAQSPTLRSPSPSANVCDPRLSSPYLQSPDHLPLRGGEHKGRQCVASVQSSFVASTRRHHHLEGERSDDDIDLAIPYETDEDDDGDLFGLFDSRFIDSGWGGECLQDAEDIDFDFVYALHTFVATVEGQANATKGDTMVLLDDSNSYWWLLSATMLGDQPDKARNTIRSAMKRRKTKTVQFAAPTYVDYSDIDYSTEEEDAEGNMFAQQQQAQQTQQAQQSAGDSEMEDETAKVEPLKPRSQQKQAKAESKRQDVGGATDSSNTSKTVSRVVDEVSEVRVDGPKKTSNGTVRDSFFKDDTVETKKITLTPNLLRDDNDPRTSSESREVKHRPSLDKLDKDGIFSKDEKKKKKDKDKDKKQGGLRGFFSRKDKKSKGEDDDDSLGKRSMEADPPEKDIEEDESQAQAEKAGPQRQTSKLQKPQPRSEPPPNGKSNSTRENGIDVKTFLSEGRVNNVANVPPVSMRVVESSPKPSLETSPRDQRPDRDPSTGKGASSKNPRAALRPAKPSAAQSRAELELEELDSDTEEDVTEPIRQAHVPAEAVRQQPAQAAQGATPAVEQPALAGAQAASRAPAVSIPPQQAERLSESPVQVSPVNSSNPPPLMVDNSNQEEERSTPSPELIEHEDADPAGPKPSTTPSTARSESWDDVSLRAFFDSGSDIRDLLVVVYDKNNVEPVGSDHPIAGSLYREQNAKLAEITTRLDDMLGDWLARKQRLRGTV
ncbi:hypothetical protein N657DRAFT_655935 [Parathielavia appendiculata]|uniref:SH3 domain-containing protein n=1 Tax=Parathielavia appendiculata TaxID=2587402 RepID=A0AAN6TZE5_9PEZI|nr:hypothetical protein N657DRAFT_655935 [Parathielavia appendiculata]